MPQAMGDDEPSRAHHRVCETAQSTHHVPLIVLLASVDHGGYARQAGLEPMLWGDERLLDLRDDPGGEVTTAQNIASLWLPDKAMIMQEKRGSTVIDSYRANGNNPLKGMPTVVLVNAGSASASEIRL